MKQTPFAYVDHELNQHKAMCVVKSGAKDTQRTKP